MRFTINLATRPYLDHRLINRIIIVTILLLLALSAWKIVIFCWNLGELERIKAEIASFEGRLSGRQAGIPEKEYKRQLSTISFFNGIIEKKTNNWLVLLDQLEKVTPAGIALVTLAPDTKTGTIKIEGRARKFDYVRLYLDQLEDSKAFNNILLLSHSDIAVGEKKNSGASGVQFVISCRLVKR